MQWKQLVERVCNKLGLSRGKTQKLATKTALLTEELATISERAQQVENERDQLAEFLEEKLETLFGTQIINLIWQFNSELALSNLGWPIWLLELVKITEPPGGRVALPVSGPQRIVCLVISYNTEGNTSRFWLAAQPPEGLTQKVTSDIIEWVRRKTSNATGLEPEEIQITYPG